MRVPPRFAVLRWAATALLGAILGVAGGALALSWVDPVYAATTEVMVAPIAGTPVDLPTEAQLARSIAINAGAPASAGRVDVRASPPGAVLIIRYEAATPAGARDGARAIASAYLASRIIAARSALDRQVTAVTERIEQLSAQLAALSTTIAALPKNSPQRSGLTAAANTLTTQIAELTTQLTSLPTTALYPGKVLIEAQLPDAAEHPVGWRYLSLGAVAGLVLASLAVTARDRFGRTIRHSRDVIRHCGVTVMAQLRAGPTLATPDDPTGQTFSRLRNEIAAYLGTALRVVVITAARPGVASTVVTLNLAAAFARADNEVILISANVPTAGPQALSLSAVFDVADIPGLSDVLAGRTSLARSLQRVRGLTGLRVITPGGAASSFGLLQSEGVRAVVTALRRQARYVLIEAPSATAGADAQSLAGLADAAILVAETGRTRRAEVTDAALQLRNVGTHLLGAVVVRGQGRRHRLGRALEPRRAGPAATVESGAAGPTPPVLALPTSARIMQAPTTAIAQVTVPPAALRRPDRPAADPAGQERQAGTPDRPGEPVTG